MIGDTWGVVGVDHRNDTGEGFDFCGFSHLHHLLYMGFDELDFFFIQAVFDIELLVNFGDGF